MGLRMGPRTLKYFVFVVVCFIMAQGLMFTEMGRDLLTGQAGLEELLPGHASGSVAFCTVVHHRDEIDGALVLGNSLAEKSACAAAHKCALVLLVTTADLTRHDRNRLADVGWTVIVHDAAPMCSGESVVERLPKGQADRLSWLSAFSLTTYGTVVYISPYAVAHLAGVDQLLAAVKQNRHLAHSPEFHVTVFRPSRMRADRLCRAVSGLGDGAAPTLTAFFGGLGYDLLPLPEPSAVHVFSPDWNPWQAEVPAVPEELADGLAYHEWWENYEAVHTGRMRLETAQEFGEWRQLMAAGPVSPETHLLLMRGTREEYVKPNSSTYTRAGLFTLPNLQLTKAAATSCDVVCGELGLKCSRAALRYFSLQDCKTADAVFGCDSCTGALAPFVPAFRRANRQCLVASPHYTAQMASCDAVSDHHERLCGCIPTTADDDEHVPFVPRPFVVGLSGTAQFGTPAAPAEPPAAAPKPAAAPPAGKAAPASKLTNATPKAPPKEAKPAGLSAKPQALAGSALPPTKPKAKEATRIEKPTRLQDKAPTAQPFQIAMALGPAKLKPAARHLAANDNAASETQASKAKPTTRPAAASVDPDFQSSRNFVDIPERPEADVEVDSDPYEADDGTEAKFCDPGNFDFHAATDDRCINQYLANRHNIRSIQPMAATLNFARTIKFRVTFRHSTKERPLKAILKVPQKKFVLEPYSELVGFKVDRLLGIKRVPPTGWVELPLEWLQLAVNRMDDVYIQWFKSFVAEYAPIQPLMRTDKYGEKHVNVSLQLWMYGLHPLEDTSLLPPAEWDDYLRVRLSTPPAWRPLMAELSDLLAFDYIIGNGDRGPHKNNYAVRSCVRNCGSGPSPDEGPPLFVHVDQGSAFYRIEGPDGNPYTSLVSNPSSKCWLFRRTTAKRIQDLASKNSRHHTLLDQLRKKTPDVVLQHIGYDLVKAAQDRLDRLAQHLATACSKDTPALLD